MEAALSQNQTKPMKRKILVTAALRNVTEKRICALKAFLVNGWSNSIVTLCAAIMGFSVVFLISCHDLEHLTRASFLQSESFSHRSSCHTDYWLLNLLPHPSIHPNEPGSSIVPCVDLGSWHKMVLNPLWFPGALSRHRFWNRKECPFPQRSRAMNSDSLCCALYPEAVLPLSQAPFPLLSCCSSLGAFSGSFLF